MILDLKYYKRFGHIKGMIKFLIFGIEKLFSPAKGKFIWGQDRLAMSALYPRLVLDENSESSCDSCNICAIVCPTSCLSIEGEEGKSPVRFEFYVDKCTGCELCFEACPQEALVMREASKELKYSKFQTLVKNELYCKQ